MTGEPDRPALKPVPEQLHAFDVFRMRVRFEDDPSRSRNHYVAAVVSVYANGWRRVEYASDEAKGTD